MAKTISKKPIYNLNLVLQETGIKADTLRAWERRYNLPQPERTDGGHRLFSEYDIETIKWLLARQEEGMRISRAVDLWNSIISSGEEPLYSVMMDQTMLPVKAATEQDLEALDYERSRWVQACLNFNEPEAEQVLTQSFAQFSLETVCIEILQAGLAEIGHLWYQGKASVQQEHFASELAIRRLHALLSAAPLPVRDETILVSCPAGENHIFSPLLISLLLRYRSWNVVFLGANVPLQQFQETIQKTHPNLVVLTSMMLATASTLLDTALFFNNLKIPVAFGGRIFNLLPELSKRIPGYYLGEDLRGSISIIEEILLGSLPPKDHEREPDQYKETIANFIEKRQLIELDTLQILAEQNADQVPIKFFRDANEHLGSDIIAALSLGNLAFLGPNVEWIHNLLPHRDIPQDIVFDYLRAYHDAAKSYLDDSGRPILEWLEQS